MLRPLKQKLCRAT